MKLTGWQFKQIQDALLSGYSQKYALAEMVRVELNEELDVIAGGDSLQEITFRLINWAEDQGKLNDLVQAAVKHNPGNVELQQLGADGARWLPQAHTLPSWPANQIGKFRGCHARIIIDLLLPVVVVTVVIIGLFDYWGNRQQVVPASAAPPAPAAPDSLLNGCGRLRQASFSASAAPWRELAAPGWQIAGEVYSVTSASGTIVWLPTLQPVEPGQVLTTTYIVQPHDTLARIATLFCISPDQLAAANGLTGTLGVALTPGTRLTIPVRTESDP